MTQYKLWRPKGEQFLDDNGDPLAGGWLSYYQEGTSTPLTVFKDDVGGTNWGTSAQLDSAGRLTNPIYVDEHDFKEVVAADNGGAPGTTVYEKDNYPGAEPAPADPDAARPLTPIEPSSSATYTMGASDIGKIIDLDDVGGNITFVPDNPADYDNGERVIVRRASASATFKVAIANTYTEDSYTLTEKHDAFELVSNGVDTWLLAMLSRPAIERITPLTELTTPDVEADFLIVRDTSESRERKVKPYRLKTVPVPQGYLTLTSATPIIVADVTAATAIYYTPLNGNLVPASNGSLFVPREFSELTLTLVSAHAASSIFDVFLFEDSGTLRIGTGPAWTTATAGAGARGTGAGTTELTRLKGLYVNAVSMTARNGNDTYTVAAGAGLYLGSIFMDGTNGQITCHRAYGQSRKWGIWNAYNRQPIIIQAGDATSSWTYGTNTIRPSNNSSANSLTVFQGLAEELYDLQFAQVLTYNAAAAMIYSVGIGWNSTSAISGRRGFVYDTDDAGTGGTSGQGGGNAIANYVHVPALGINTVTALERADGAIAPSILGTETNMILSARWRG